MKIPPGVFGRATGIAACGPRAGPAMTMTRADDSRHAKSRFSLLPNFGVFQHHRGIAVVRRRTIRTNIQPTFIQRNWVHLSGSLGRPASRQLPSPRYLREFDFRSIRSNSRKNHSGLGVEDSFGVARALGAAEGECLTLNSASSHRAYEWLHGPSVSGTSFDFDRPTSIGPSPNLDGRSDRSRLTRTQA